MGTKRITTVGKTISKAGKRYTASIRVDGKGKYELVLPKGTVPKDVMDKLEEWGWDQLVRLAGTPKGVKPVRN
jgi:hypothetical protein